MLPSCVFSTPLPHTPCNVTTLSSHSSTRLIDTMIQTTAMVMVGQSLQLSQALCVLSFCRSYLRAVSLQAVINSEQDFSVFQSHLEHC